MKDIRIGGVPEHFNLPWHLAMEKKAFLNKKIQIRWVDFKGGTGAMAEALKEKKIELAVMLTEGAVAHICKNPAYKIIQYYVTSPLIWGIHVPYKSKYNSIHDIKNALYAISRIGSGSHLMAYVHAYQKGWTIDKEAFKIVNHLQGAVDALNQEEADVFFWEKYTTKPYVDKKIFRRIGECPTPWPCFVLVARQDILENHLDEIKTIQHTIIQSCGHITPTHHYTSLIASKYNLKYKDVTHWLARTSWAKNNTIVAADIEKVSKMLFDIKQINRLPTMTDLCDNRCTKII